MDKNLNGDIFSFGVSRFIAAHLSDVNLSLKKFLNLRYQESTTSVETDGASASVIGADALADLITPEGVQILKDLKTEVSKKLLQTFYDLYMSPLGDTDIKYRLGAVTGIKPSPAVVANMTAEQIAADKYNFKQQDSYDRDNLVTDSVGRIYTRTNFVTKFKSRYYNTSTGKESQFIYNYVNLFFPPYKFGYDVTSGASYDKLINEWRNRFVYNTSDAQLLTYDMTTFKASRGGFTYRTPAFKSINDNITFLQYILEQTTGMVSTYLTEWDLSIYIQEGLLPVHPDSGLPPVIWLLNRIRDDNPLNNTQYYGYYADDAALSFGIVNAAVSKLFGDNEKIWRPTDFPLSCFWSPYWACQSVDLLNNDPSLGEREALARTISTHAARGDVIIYDGAAIPTFYFPERSAGYQSHDWRYVSDSLPFRDLVRLYDERNAALSGWSSWDGLRYYRVFYTTSEDGISETDTTVDSIDKKSQEIYLSNGKPGVIKKLRSNCAANGGAYSADTLAGAANGLDLPVIDDSGNVTSTSEFGGGGDGSGSSGGNMAARLTKYLLYGSKEGDVNPNDYLNQDSSASGLNESVANGSGIATKNSSGYADASTMIDDFLNSNATPRTAAKAKTIGIAQHNPPLFGGPHGKGSSPRTPQSYFEIDNDLVRNMPRIEANTHSSFTNMAYSDYIKDGWKGDVSQFYNAIKGVKADGSEEHYNVNNEAERLLGNCDQSPSLALHRLQQGVFDWTWDYTTSVEITYKFYRGEIRTTYSRCSTYIWFPTTNNGQYIWYRGGIVYGWFLHEQPYLSATYKWFEGGYWSYINENSISSMLWRTGYWYWSIRTWAPHRFGYTRVFRYRRYKKYLCHNDPLVNWSMTQIAMMSYHTYYDYASKKASVFGWYTNNFYKRSSIPNFKAWSYKNDIAYKLDVSYDSDHWAVNTIFGMLIRSARLEQWQNNFLKDRKSPGYTNLFFCEGSTQTLMNRLTNGPQAIFRCPVGIEQHWVPYYEHHWKYKCGKARHHCWITRYRSVTYLSARPDRADIIYNDLQTPVYTSKNEDQTMYYQDLITSKYAINNDSILRKFSYGKTYHWDINASGRFQQGTYGIKGWGVFQNIPGLNAEIENSWFEDYDRLMNMSSQGKSYDVLANTAIKDLPIKYSYIKKYNSPFRSDEFGSVQYMPGGFPDFALATVDPGMRQAITKIYTRATFYKSDGTCYGVAFDTCIRLLLQQVLWQLSFLETARDMYATEIDFSIVREMINECIDESVLEASRRNQRNLTAFDYWIYRACKIFDVATAQQQANKNTIVAKFNARMSSLEQAVPALKVVAAKDITQCSLNEILNAINSVQTVQMQLNEVSEIEIYTMSYLSVLYHYRKYYINKRFNKQDGTMWQMRHLESVLPFFVQEFSINEPPSWSNLVNRAPSSVPVAYYDVTNKPSDKVKALNGGAALDEDRICKTYTKVNYVTEKDYLDDQKRVKEGEEPRVVYIKERKKYAEKPADGMYSLHSDELQKQVIEPNEYNKSLADRQKTLAQVDPAKAADLMLAKKDVADIDECTQYIKWENAPGYTPIYFGVTTSVDLSKMQEMMKNGTSESTALEILCGSRKESDYWTVTVNKEQQPRKSGYLSNVKWKIYKIDEFEFGIGDTLPEVTVNGALAYTLWPITDEQADASPNAGANITMADQIKQKIADISNGGGA